MGHAIGIDIGTANTRVAVYRNGRVEIITDKNGQRSMPSYVAFTERCRLFGSAAEAHADHDPRSTVYGVKRVLGQSLGQKHVDRYTNISPNDVWLEPPGRMAISVLYKTRPSRILPVQVFGMLLTQARANAEAYLGETVQDAVISVPTQFDRLQRLDVYDAAQLAGLTPVYISTSIESIALYHAFTTQQEDENVYVFLDLGAVFFNAGLVAIKGVTVDVLSATSDTDVGGEVLINRIQSHFAAEIQKEWRWDIKTDIKAHRRLRIACEAAMRELSSTVSARILIDSLHDGKDFSGNLSREMLEQLCQSVFSATLNQIDRVLDAVPGRKSKSLIKGWRERLSTHKGRDKSSVKDKWDKSSVKEVIMVGGCSRIPKLQEIWSNYFDSKSRVHVVNRDEREVLGSAIYAANFSAQPPLIKGKLTSPTAWNPVMPRNRKDIEFLITQAAAYEQDDALEEALVAKRCALDLRLASLGEIQPTTFQTKKMAGLIESLVLWRNRLDELESGSLADYREYGKALDEVERGLKVEELRVVEITGLRSHADELRTKLTATTQTPKTEALLQYVDSVTQWVDENEEAEIQEYRAKLHSLMAVSLELITLSEAPPSRESTPSNGTAQHPENGTRAQTNRPRGLDELFPESGWDTQSKYTDAELGDIASYLGNTGHESWSKVPRIYTVLRLVGQVELIDAFLQRGMTDIWFPFSDNTLPKALKQPHRTQFLQAQEAVFSKALKLERGARFDDQRSNRKHAHFSRSEPLPFKVIGNLGSGAHGVVDKVVSTMSYKEYARKRFKRPLGSTAKQNEAKSFLNEVKILKKLHNKHCIDLVGSYSDPRHFALIMHPVAECNLENYYTLALEDRDKRSILQGFFGCLAGTLDYLHSQKVVHQDIKPQNILVKDNSHVLVTDFGIARSWEGLTRATTTADLDRTWVYAAPEVARGGPKNETADVWSLGCVFLEMCTVLKGQSPADMRAFFKGRSDSASFHDNAAPGHVSAWVGSLREQSPPELNRALEWVSSMLQVEPRHRCRPFELFDRIVAASESTSVLFCGACCRDRGESAPESNDEHTDRWSEGDDEDI